MRLRHIHFASFALLGLIELALAFLLTSQGSAGHDQPAIRAPLIGAMFLAPIIILAGLRVVDRWHRQKEALERSEQRANLALDGARMAYWDIDIDTGRGTVNAYWHELLGTTPDEVGDDIHNTWVAMLHPDDRQRVLEVGRRYKSGELPVYEVEYRCITRQGDVRWFTSKGMLVRQGDDPQPHRIVGVFHDVTARKEGEIALRQAKEEAEAASRVKSEFLANVTHEIRTPIDGILGLTELLLSSPLDPLQRTQLGMIRESAESLLVTVNNVLDFARIETRRLDLLPSSTPIRDIIALTLQPLAPLAKAKGLTLDTTIDDDIPERVLCDALRLRQILSNLIGNAIKFTNHGKITVRIENIKETDCTVRLGFMVQDTGIGIPPQEQQRIFEAFSQGGALGTRHQGGIGLGLSIAAHLVELMDGKLELQSTPGQGSTFSFSISIPKIQMPRSVSERRCPQADQALPADQAPRPA